MGNDLMALLFLLLGAWSLLRAGLGSRDEMDRKGLPLSWSWYFLCLGLIVGIHTWFPALQTPPVEMLLSGAMLGMATLICVWHTIFHPPSRLSASSKESASPSSPLQRLASSMGHSSSSGEEEAESFSWINPVLASFDAPVALLDSEGVICQCNDAWLDKGAGPRFLGAGLQPGTNYLDFCRHMSAIELSAAKQIAEVLANHLHQQPLHKTEKSYFTVGTESPARFRLQLIPIPNPSDRAGKVFHLNIHHLESSESPGGEGGGMLTDLVIHSLFDQAPVMMHSMDREGKIVRVSDAWLEALGYERMEVLGRQWQEFLTPDSQHYYKSLATPRFERTGICKDVPYQVVKKNKQIRDVLLSAVAERDPQENILGMTAILVDVTEGKRAEVRRMQLMEDQQKYVSLVQNSGDFIGMWTFEGDPMFVNRAGNRLVGVRGQGPDNSLNLKDYYMPHTARLLEKEILPRVLDTEQWQGEGQLKHLRSGDPIDVQMNFFLVRGALSGDPLCVACVQRDIRQRKRHENELRRQALVFENLHDAVLITDWSGQVLDCNPAAERLFGNPKKHLVRNPPPLEFPISQDVEEASSSSMSGEASAKHPLWAVQQAIESEGRFQGESHFLRPGGETIICESVIVPLRDQAQKITALIGVHHDITERKRNLKALQSAKEAAEVANRTKTEFLANMSHEIRTPMNAIIGMTALALDTELQPLQREFLTTVRDSASSLLRLLNDLLDLSKIEAGRFDLDRLSFSLRNCLDDPLKTLALKACQKRLHFGYSVAPDVPDTLIGDPDRLKQVVLNLTDNAIKFTSTGEVEVRVETAAEQPLPDGMTEESICLHFQVKDTGIGIPPEKQSLIFDAFTQADGSTRRRFGGTGLGLAICQQMIHLMDGKFWVESRENRGSTFHFLAWFGLDSEETSHDTLPQAIGDVRNLRVILYEPVDLYQRILLESLDSWNIQTTVADSTEHTLELWQTHLDAKPNEKCLILLGGTEEDETLWPLINQLRSRPAFAESIVMMISASNRLSRSDRYRQWGIERLVVRPISPLDLLDALRRTLGLSSARTRPKPSLSSREDTKQYKVLLAEDTEVNQQLAVRILERSGHRVVVASNGRMALEIWQQEPFDVILMDLQMPEMDGLEATEQIRSIERDKQLNRIPIIALTAHTMPGDRDRCIQAGMDAYLAKPIHPHELKALLSKVVSKTSIPIDPRDPGESTEVATSSDLMMPSDAFLELNTVLARLDGDFELLEELAQLFLNDSPQLMEQIEDAITVQDGQELTVRAHRLKGVVSNFEAHAAREAAEKLEEIGHRMDFVAAREAFREVSSEVQQLSEVLKNLRNFPELRTYLEAN
ncbi:Hypothetical protein PBC10988_31670 [Planctomycetales bacterium 10988]|nr:Hypothetical protein PBC10988_31670 [Planctomycetales bacterium 10988]